MADDFVPPVKGGTPNAQAMAMIARVRHKILKRSGATFTGMRRSLRVMDTNGNHSLNAVELKEGLARYGIALSDPEVSVLVKYFDKSGDGEVSIGEFVRGIRDDMNERRATLTTYRAGHEPHTHTPRCRVTLIGGSCGTRVPGWA